MDKTILELKDFNIVIKVFGIGGAGTNAVSRMYQDNIEGVEFYVCNTDAQHLSASPIKNKILLGASTTKGQGAGADPEKGKKAAIESEEEIKVALKGADMVFIAAGMGGGTGTGAGPVFAKLAKEIDALVVSVVTTPFRFEGPSRKASAIIGLDQLKEYTDTTIVISNDTILALLPSLKMQEGFQEADNILRQGVQTITDLILNPSIVNLDFADIRKVMSDKGTALFGVGKGEGENKAEIAANEAIKSPLLGINLNGTKNAIVNICTGNDCTIYETDRATEIVTNAFGEQVDIMFGYTFNEDLSNAMIVTIVATGFDLDQTREAKNAINTNKPINPKPEKVVTDPLPTTPNFFNNRK